MKMLWPKLQHFQINNYKFLACLKGGKRGIYEIFN